MSDAGRAGPQAGALRQRLGRRLGLEPYYVVAERAPGQLRLESRPEANRRPGLAILAVGVALLLAGALIVISGAIAGAIGGGFSVAVLSAAVGGLLGGLGFQRAAGGYAVITTRNSIVADSAARELRLTQVNRLAGERQQTLPYDAVSGMRLRRRPLVVGGLLRRIRPIVALELLAGDEIWLIDSAADGELLRPAAEALGLELDQGTAGA